MTQKPPSPARISLLLTASLIAGIFVSSLVTSRWEPRQDKPQLRIDQSLAVESP